MPQNIKFSRSPKEYKNYKRSTNELHYHFIVRLYDKPEFIDFSIIIYDIEIFGFNRFTQGQFEVFFEITNMMNGKIVANIDMATRYVMFLMIISMFHWNHVNF